MPQDSSSSSPEAREPVDLLLVGALTIDRPAGGSAEAGGSVLHGARAAHAADASVGIITTAGSEPSAQAGLAELTQLAIVVRVAEAGRSVAFRLREGNSKRRLWLERRTAKIGIEPAEQFQLLAHAVLFAPVLDEIPDTALDLWDWTRRGACLQGWLRRADEGGDVRPIDLASLREELVRRLSKLDVLFASHEDLAMAGDAPRHQVDALRRRIGPGPLLIVTAGVDGAWFDIDRPAWRSRSRWHLPVPIRVDGVPATGAGDAFAALFLAGYDGMPLRRDVSKLALRAMEAVASMLERRRP